jgi:hypothetical protein
MLRPAVRGRAAPLAPDHPRLLGPTASTWAGSRRGGKAGPSLDLATSRRPMSEQCIWPAAGGALAIEGADAGSSAPPQPREPAPLAGIASGHHDERLVRSLGSAADGVAPASSVAGARAGGASALRYIDAARDRRAGLAAGTDPGQHARLQPSDPSAMLAISPPAMREFRAEQERGRRWDVHSGPGKLLSRLGLARSFRCSFARKKRSLWANESSRNVSRLCFCPSSRGSPPGRCALVRSLKRLRTKSPPRRVYGGEWVVGRARCVVWLSWSACSKLHHLGRWHLR